MFIKSQNFHSCVLEFLVVAFVVLGLLTVFCNDAQILIKSRRSTSDLQPFQVDLFIQVRQVFGRRGLQTLITEATVCQGRIRLEIEFYVLLVQGLVVIELVEAVVFFVSNVSLLVVCGNAMVTGFSCIIYARFYVRLEEFFARFNKVVF